MIQHFGVHSPFWSVGNIRKNNRRQINYPLCGSSDFHTHFLNYHPHQTKHSVSQFRVFFFKHNSVQQHTRPGQCSTCIKLHDYKLVVKHPKCPSPTPNVRLATVLPQRPTSGSSYGADLPQPPSPTADLHYTAPFLTTERPRQFTYITYHCPSWPVTQH